MGLVERPVQIRKQMWRSWKRNLEHTRKRKAISVGQNDATKDVSSMKKWSCIILNWLDGLWCAGFDLYSLLEYRSNPAHQSQSNQLSI